MSIVFPTTFTIFIINIITKRRRRIREIEDGNCFSLLKMKMIGSEENKIFQGKFKAIGATSIPTNIRSAYHLLLPSLLLYRSGDISCHANRNIIILKNLHHLTIVVTIMAITITILTNDRNRKQQ